MNEKDIVEIEAVGDVLDDSEAPQNSACKPDPFWPEDAIPLHLSVAQRRAATEAGTFVALKAVDWKCAKCGTEYNPSQDNPTLCKKCDLQEKQTTQLFKKTNSSWMEDAKEYGLEIFERQPEETNTDWRIWEQYRNYYPMKLPTWSELAEAAGVSVGTVVKASQRWSYKVRIIDWARYCDAQIQEKRVQTVQEVNNAQGILAKTMLDKVTLAIRSLEPQFMKPNEIVNMAKLATEMQRKTAEYKEETIQQPGIIDKVSAGQEITKVEDLNEIASILMNAGALGSGSKVGIEKTTRIVVSGGDTND